MPRPTLECCTPYGAPAPSGWRWLHSRKCSRYPGQWVGAERTPERIAAVQSRLAHPAGSDVGGNHAVEMWLQHPPKHGCAECQYVEAWLDRDDADGFREDEELV